MGINFNDLPQNLQAKLQPFMSVAKSVDDAISMAKQNGKWSEEDTKAMNALNGGANWGNVVDSFDPKKAAEYKKDYAQHKPKQNKEEQKEDFFTYRFTDKNGKFSAKETAISIAKMPLGLAFMVLGGGVTSCTTDIEQNQAVTVNIPSNKQKDYLDEIKAMRAELQAINGKLSNIEQALADKYDAILGRLDTIIKNNQATEQNYTIIFNQILDWLEQIQSGQVKIQTDNNKNAQDIIAAMNIIIGGEGTIAEKLDKIMELLKQIKSIGESIDDKLVKVLENDERVIKALEKLDKNDQEIKKVLTDIYAMMDKYGKEFNCFFKQIICKLGDGNAKLGDIKALLASIDAKLSKFSDETKNQLLAIFNKIGSAPGSGAAQKDYDAKFDKIIALLEKLDANNDARNQKVLEAINKLGLNVSTSLTAILNKIGTGGSSSGDTKDYTSLLNAILAKLGDIDANNSKNFQRVIDAMAKLNVGGGSSGTVSVDLQPILNKLDEILKAIKDHKVVVDVTGKVECNCNCGNGTKHEGIIGDLNNLLG